MGRALGKPGARSERRSLENSAIVRGSSLASSSLSRTNGGEGRAGGHFQHARSSGCGGAAAARVQDSLVLVSADQRATARNDIGRWLGTDGARVEGGAQRLWMGRTVRQPEARAESSLAGVIRRSSSAGARGPTAAELQADRCIDEPEYQPEQRRS